MGGMGVMGEGEYMDASGRRGPMDFNSASGTDVVITFVLVAILAKGYTSQNHYVAGIK